MTVNEAMLQKNAQREKALSDAARKTEELDEKYPDIAEIDKELSSVSAQIISALSSENCSERIEKIKERNLSLQEMRKEKLISYGISPQYDTPVFSCPLCSDTGYDGKTFCRCVIKRQNFIA